MAEINRHQPHTYTIHVNDIDVNVLPRETDPEVEIIVHGKLSERSKRQIKAAIEGGDVVLREKNIA